LQPQSSSLSVEHKTFQGLSILISLYLWTNFLQISQYLHSIKFSFLWQSLVQFTSQETMEQLQQDNSHDALKCTLITTGRPYDSGQLKTEVKNDLLNFINTSLCYLGLFFVTWTSRAYLRLHGTCNSVIIITFCGLLCKGTWAIRSHCHLYDFVSSASTGPTIYYSYSATSSGYVPVFSFDARSHVYDSLYAGATITSNTGTALYSSSSASSSYTVTVTSSYAGAHVIDSSCSGAEISSYSLICAWFYAWGWMSASLGITLIRLGYGRTRRAWSNGCAKDENYSSLAFNFELFSLRKSSIRYVAVVVVFISVLCKKSSECKPSRSPAPTGTIVDYDKRVAYS
jgi:hypothetical protein